MTARVRQDGSRSVQSANESSLDLRSNLLKELPLHPQFAESLADADCSIKAAFKILDAVRIAQQQRIQQEKQSKCRAGRKRR